LSRNGHSGEKYNIAAAEESDNLKIAQMVSSILGKKLKYQLRQQNELYNQFCQFFQNNFFL